MYLQNGGIQAKLQFKFTNETYLLYLSRDFEGSSYRQQLISYSNGLIYIIFGEKFIRGTARDLRNFSSNFTRGAQNLLPLPLSRPTCIRINKRMI